MRKPKEPPPAQDDPRYLRTCNLCGRVRHWIAPKCECGGVEFSIPDVTEVETDDEDQS